MATTTPPVNRPIHWRPHTQSDLTREQGLFRVDPQRIAGPMYAAYEAAGVSPLPDVSRIIDTTLLDTVFQGRSTI